MPDTRQEEFLNLPFQEKLEFLYGLPARQKRDLILSAPEAERLVQSFAPETLFYTLKEIGVADAGDLLSLGVPGTDSLALRPRLLGQGSARILDGCASGSRRFPEAGRKRMAEGMMELDLELVSLLLRQYIRVHRLADPQDSPDAPSDRFVQFDENYLIEFIRHDAIHAHILDFLEEIFERDYNYFTGLMDEIYWGVEAELEEQAYQFRSSRLADRGFPDYFDAQSVFAYLNPQHFQSLRAQYPAPIRDGIEDNDVLPPGIVAGAAGGREFAVQRRADGGLRGTGQTPVAQRDGDGQQSGAGRALGRFRRP